MLLEQRDADTRLPHDAPSRRSELAGDQTKQRRFSGAIAPQDPPTLPRRHREGYVLEKSRGAELHGHVRDLKLCHPRPRIVALTRIILPSTASTSPPRGP